MITNKLENSLQFFFPYDWCFYSIHLLLLVIKIVEGVEEEEGGRERGRGRGGRGRERDRDREEEEGILQRYIRITTAKTKSVEKMNE